ncbi:MAG: tyrosine-protein kinase family protein [Clostridia bacterium]
MAITFAQAGFKTLLIDADMRKIQLYHYFSVPAKPGLSEVLAGLEDVLPIHDTPYENLKLMTGGTIPPNPAELLMSKKMDEMLETLRVDYDYIFIDTPPVLAVTDAAALAPKVTGLVMMSRQDYTKTEDIRLALEDLNRVGAKVVGILFNGFNAEAHSYKYKGDYHYRYYESYEAKR